VKGRRRNFGFTLVELPAVSKGERQAFTLVELLVVIGIIAVLIGVLLPSLVRARQSANAVACTSNLRQWGAATELYAVTNHGYLPRRGQGVGITTMIDRPEDWFNALPSILHMPTYSQLAAAGKIFRPDGPSSIWICPSAVDPGDQNYWSYGMNMALSVTEQSQNYGLPDKITGVGNTTIMVLFADAPGDHCSIFPSVTPDGYNPVPRHNKRVNICFLDGHVAAIDGSYLAVDVGMIPHADIRWHPPGNTWDSAH
jgi:prepilin-type processing-associated H-X9-DG protein/prepilin-type N-terminal cleavage/methylation domain-containing protein